MLTIAAKLVALTTVYWLIAAGTMVQGLDALRPFVTEQKALTQLLDMTNASWEFAAAPAVAFFLTSWFLMRRVYALPLSRYAPPVVIAGFLTPFVSLVLFTIWLLVLLKLKYWEAHMSPLWYPIAVSMQLMWALPGVLSAWLMHTVVGVQRNTVAADA